MSPIDSEAGTELGADRFIQSFKAIPTESGGWDCEVKFDDDLAKELKLHNSDIVSLLNSVDGISSFVETPAPDGTYIVFLPEGEDTTAFQENLKKRVSEILSGADELALAA